MAIVPIKNHSSKGQALCVCVQKTVGKKIHHFTHVDLQCLGFLLYYPHEIFLRDCGRVQKFHQMNKKNKFLEHILETFLKKKQKYLITY